MAEESGGGYVGHEEAMRTRPRKLVRVYNRVVRDYFWGARLDEYGKLIEQALKLGYESHSVVSYARMALSGQLMPDKKYLILRHDVDAATAVAREMAKIEFKHGARSTFYFRLTTIDAELMKEIEANGSEASYHYEEIATLVKAVGLPLGWDPSHVIRAARELFRENLTRLRAQLGLPMLTVASHGDFGNRKVNLVNASFVEDVELRRELGILAEAYDEDLNRPVTYRVSDSGFPHWWRDRREPYAGLEGGSQVVYILTHPQWWRCERFENLMLSFQRIKEELHYRSQSRKFQHLDPHIQGRLIDDAAHRSFRASWGNQSVDFLAPRIGTMEIESATILPGEIVKK